MLQKIAEFTGITLTGCSKNFTMEAAKANLITKKLRFGSIRMDMSGLDLRMV